MLMQSLLATMAVTLAQAGQPEISTNEAVIENCEIGSVQNLDVPASEAGVMTRLHVKEGEEVDRNEIVGTVDDREARALYEVKRLEYEVAKQLAESDVKIRHSKKAADVAKKEYEKFKTIDANLQGAVTQIDLLRKQFEWERTLLAIEQSTEEDASNELTADSKKAELDAAQVALDRRNMVAPFKGVVARTYVQEGEWVQPGDAVLQLVRIDRLRVGGRLDASEWSRGDIENRKVTVEVTLPRGRTVKVPGQIVFVSPVVEVGGNLPVVAEIDTPMQNDEPLVYAGMQGRMTIHTNQPAVPKAKSVTRAQARPPVTPVRRSSARK